MRQVLIDWVRRKQRVRPGGHLERTDPAEVDLVAPVPANSDVLLGLDEAIGELERKEPLKASIVKRTFFVGLTDKRISARGFPSA